MPPVGVAAVCAPPCPALRCPPYAGRQKTLKNPLVAPTCVRSVGLVNHLGHEICQELEVWTATFYAQRNAIPQDTDVEKFAQQLLEKRAAAAPKRL